MPYKPISDYGVVGDMRTAALISSDCSIDWLCWPDFDSPSIFGALLDSRVGGFFRVGPGSDGFFPTQRYIADTNVLVTRFEGSGSTFEITDFMPVDSGVPASPSLIRLITAVRGTARVRAECHPAFDYGRGIPKARLADGGVVFSPQTGPALRFIVDGARIQLGGAAAELIIPEGESRTVALVAADGPHQITAAAALDATIAYWRDWIRRTTYRGRWREAVRRSLLTLKLLTYQPTGAIIAAPTTSLPESPNGARNWDYRYTWVRDSAFAISAFMRAGLYDEATAYLRFVEDRHMESPDEPLRLIYGIRGERQLEERELPHLEGYRGSAPVRIGNNAYRQLQLDFLGELVWAIDHYNHNGTRASDRLRTWLCSQLDWLADNWALPDEGIWEIRGSRQHFTHSKLMAWSALQRGLTLMNGEMTPDRTAMWTYERDRIQQAVLEQGWNDAAGSFVQYLGADQPDASLLQIPTVGFLRGDDYRVVSTIDRIRDRLSAGHLVYRYDHSRAAPDGLSGAEGAFGICSFWMVDALVESGRLADAVRLFERMLAQASPLGLYSEEISITGDLCGNYPQGLTHLGLINSAIRLDAALASSNDSSQVRI